MGRTTECHKCKTRMQFEDDLKALEADMGALREMYGEKCAACKGFAEISCKGITFVHVDSAEPDIGERIYQHRRTTEDYASEDGGILNAIEPPADRSTVNLPEGIAEYLRTLLVDFIYMKDKDLLVCQGLARGETMVDIASRLGVTKVMVWKRFHRLLERHPYLRALASSRMKIASQGK